MERQERIENALARRHLQDGVLVLYDVSSSYVEGRHCPLAQFGYSRDHRGDRPRIVYGLLCTREGLPIAIEVFEGNTGDPSTVRSQVDKLKGRFGLRRVVLVEDRGMITAARIRDDLKTSGLDWISCLRAPHIQALARGDGPLQLSLFDERDPAEISSPDFPGERLIVCRNGDLARERARKREALLGATERDLVRIQAQVRRKGSPLRSAAEIGLAVGEVINARMMAKHFALDIRDGDFSWQRRLEQIAAEAKLDGIYVIRTSVPAEDLSTAHAVQAYKDLSRVERAFRSMKTVDLEIRQIRHWNADWVRAHACAFGHPHRPALQRRSLHRPREYNVRRLVKNGPHRGIPDLRDPSGDVRLARLILPRCQAKMGSHHARRPEPCGTIASSGIGSARLQLRCSSCLANFCAVPDMAMEAGLVE